EPETTVVASLPSPDTSGTPSIGFEWDATKGAYVRSARMIAPPGAEESELSAPPMSAEEEPASAPQKASRRHRRQAEEETSASGPRSTRRSSSRRTPDILESTKIPEKTETAVWIPSKSHLRKKRKTDAQDAEV